MNGCDCTGKTHLWGCTSVYIQYGHIVFLSHFCFISNQYDAGMFVRSQFAKYKILVPMYPYNRNATTFYAFYICRLLLKLNAYCTTHKE